MILLWIGGFAAFLAITLTMTPSSPDETTDAVVVFTGGENRIETGLQLFANGRAAHLFISGVHPDVSKRTIMRTWREEPSLPPCCLTLDHEARTTEQNARETRKWLVGSHFTSLRLVTANYHIFRAALELEHALPGIRIIKHPVKQPGLTMEKSRFWIVYFGEYNKTLYRHIRLLFSWPEPLAEESS